MKKPSTLDRVSAAIVMMSCMFILSKVAYLLYTLLTEPADNTNPLEGVVALPVLCVTAGFGLFLIYGIVETAKVVFGKVREIDDQKLPKK